ncbi:MAG: hypothetical protein KME16_25935 [Scytolyngbya sp. HA4215-MV1]|nr:hypothetical protein [Scytolyngbya sp. HA4215-MV1]
MARLAIQGELSLPAAEEREQSPPAIIPTPFTFALAQQMRGWFETLGYRFEKYEVWETDYFEWIINVPVRRNRFDRILYLAIPVDAYDSFFSLELPRLLIQRYQVHLIIYEPAEEVIVLWQK